MKGRFDRNLFWPHGIPAPSISGFPLANLGDAEWLTKTVEFIGATDASEAFLE
jgi:hypothetical protein